MELPLTNDAVREFVFSLPALKTILGEVETARDLRVREIGDGNINFIFIVEGPRKGLVLKQGLSYIRLIGPSWKLTQDRVRIEASWLSDQHRITPEHVPEMYHYDSEKSLIIMEYLPPPFVNLRTGILHGEIYPKLAQHVSEFLADSLFHGSRLAMKNEQHREHNDVFHNPELCATTAKVIFVDPYHDEPLNKFLRPELNEVVDELWNDQILKIATCRLRDLFLTKRESIIHGDFHTGSVMACEVGLFVIDAEFAFAGPMGFDIGKFLGNLLLTYFALDGHLTEANPRTPQQEWLLNSVIQIWTQYKDRFLRLWNENKMKGELLPIQFLEYEESSFLEEFQNDFMESLFREVLSFGGACMIRRIVSIAQIQDFTTIPDREMRATCSKRALKLARIMLRQILPKEDPLGVEKLVQLAKTIRSEV